MILVPFQWIERLSYPIASQHVLATEGFLYGDRSKPLADSRIRLSSPMQFPSSATVISSDGALFPEKSAEIQIDVKSGDPTPVLETRAFSEEDFATDRVTEPQTPHFGGSCNTDDEPYRELFGANGSIQRCKEQFVESRFSPRKAVLLSRRDVRAHDFGSKIHGPTDVCVVAVSLVSHAA